MQEDIGLPITLIRWEKAMVWPASTMTACFICTLILGPLAPPAFAGDYRSDHAHAYDDHDDVDCHPVTRAYDYHGRPALFGGMMCRDDYGNAWISQGSRYFIRYLGYDDGYDHHYLDPLPDDDYEN